MYVSCDMDVSGHAAEGPMFRESILGQQLAPWSAMHRSQNLRCFDSNPFEKYVNLHFIDTNQKDNEPLAPGDLLHLYHRSKACIVCRAFRSALKPTKASLLGLDMVWKM